jgi:hypothetical protein
MFQVVGITVLTFIAITIAAVSLPRRPRSTGRRHHEHGGFVHAERGWADTDHQGE